MNRKAREAAKLAAIKEQEGRRYKKFENSVARIRCDEIERIKSDCEHRLRDHEYEEKRLKGIISIQERRIELYDMATKERVDLIESLRRQRLVLESNYLRLENEAADLRLRLASYRRLALRDEPEVPKEIQQYDGIRKLILDD
jgi:hypothetical protein